MDLSLSAEQQQLVDAFGALYAKESTVERVRAAEPLGHDAQLWARLLEVGALEMAVGEDSGGWGATLADLALVAEQHGRALGPAPVVEAQVAARLLARTGTPAASEALRRALGGSLTTVALHPPVRGRLTMVPAGAVADEVVFADGDRVFAAPVGEPVAVANLGSMPVADLIVGAAVELAAGPAARAAADAALDDWLVLTANALVGIGRRALEIGVAYVQERTAFGAPIGSFQSVSHGLAEAATAMEGASLLAREAAWAVDGSLPRAAELAALAFAFCTESARGASERSLHYHGGYGFMLEYDVQLYFRRAKAWPALFAEPAVAYARAAEHRLAGHLPADQPSGGEG